MTGDIALVFGTRPEAIKLFVLAEHLGPRARLVHTGQHFDDALALGVARDLALPAADVQFDIGGRRRGAQVGRATELLTELFVDDRPGAVVVQGDTNSALAGALAANAEAVPLVHVEAGLRSHDRAMPEEHNRVLIDHVSDLCAAPTDAAARNLRSEGIDPGRIHRTGNTVVEAVERMLPDGMARRRYLHDLGVTPNGYVLATLHRPENVDRADDLRRILTDLAALPVPVMFPIHPRTAKNVERFGLTALLDPLHILPPLLPSDFLALAKEARIIVSDSGGVQEEVSVLKKRVVVVRRSTERPEALGSFAELVEIPDLLDRAVAAIDRGDESLSTEPSPFGDGLASARIAELSIALAAAAHEPEPFPQPKGHTPDVDH